MRLEDVVLYQKYMVDGKKMGVVMFKGKTRFGKGEWVGLSLERQGAGYHNGTYQDIEYFRCNPGHGIFVRPSALASCPTGTFEKVDTEELKDQNRSGHNVRTHSMEQRAEMLAELKVNDGENLPDVSNSAILRAIAESRSNLFADKDNTTGGGEFGDEDGKFETIQETKIPFNSPEKEKVNSSVKSPVRSSTSNKSKKRQQRVASGVWVWGENRHGELGIGEPIRGNSKCQHRPAQVKTAEGSAKVAQIVLGQQHSVVLSADSSVYTCGSWTNGLLGIPKISNDIYRYRRVKSLGSKSVHIACGNHHTVAIKEDGRLWAWGGTLHGKLGHLEAHGGLCQVSGLYDQKVVDVDCGKTHTILCTDDGVVYVFGILPGVDGLSKTTGSSPTRRRQTIGAARYVAPRAVKGALGLCRVVSVAAGTQHNLVCSEDGELYSWGLNDYGQLGYGTTQSSRTPKLVKMEEKTISISCGDKHSLVVDCSGKLFSFGCGIHGQLGHGVSRNERRPRRVDAFQGRVLQAEAGSNHSVVLTCDGEVYTWGLGNRGQLGHGTLSDSSKPTLVTGLPKGIIKQVAAGGSHTLASEIPFLPVKEMLARLDSKSPAAVQERRREMAQLSSSSSSSLLRSPTTIGHHSVQHTQGGGRKELLRIEDDDPLKPPPDDAAAPVSKNVNTGTNNSDILLPCTSPPESNHSSFCRINTTPPTATKLPSPPELPPPSFEESAIMRATARKIYFEDDDSCITKQMVEEQLGEGGRGAKSTSTSIIARSAGNVVTVTSINDLSSAATLQTFKIEEEEDDEVDDHELKQQCDANDGGGGVGALSPTSPPLRCATGTNESTTAGKGGEHPPPPSSVLTPKGTPVFSKGNLLPLPPPQPTPSPSMGTAAADHSTRMDATIIAKSDLKGGRRREDDHDHSRSSIRGRIGSPVVNMSPSPIKVASRGSRGVAAAAGFMMTTSSPPATSPHSSRFLLHHSNRGSAASFHSTRGGGGGGGQNYSSTTRQQQWLDASHTSSGVNSPESLAKYLGGGDSRVSSRANLFESADSLPDVFCRSRLEEEEDEEGGEAEGIEEGKDDNDEKGGGGGGGGHKAVLSSSSSSSPIAGLNKLLSSPRSPPPVIPEVVEGFGSTIKPKPAAAEGGDNATDSAAAADVTSTLPPISSLPSPSSKTMEISEEQPGGGVGVVFKGRERKRSSLAAVASSSPESSETKTDEQRQVMMMLQKSTSDNNGHEDDDDDDRTMRVSSSQLSFSTSNNNNNNYGIRKKAAAQNNNSRHGDEEKEEEREESKKANGKNIEEARDDDGNYHHPESSKLLPNNIPHNTHNTLIVAAAKDRGLMNSVPSSATTTTTTNAVATLMEIGHDDDGAAAAGGGGGGAAAAAEKFNPQQQEEKQKEGEGLESIHSDNHVKHIDDDDDGDGDGERNIHTDQLPTLNGGRGGGGSRNESNGHNAECNQDKYNATESKKDSIMMTTPTGLLLRGKINNNNVDKNSSRDFQESDSAVSSIKGDISAAFQLFNQDSLNDSLGMSRLDEVNITHDEQSLGGGGGGGISFLDDDASLQYSNIGGKRRMRRIGGEEALTPAYSAKKKQSQRQPSSLRKVAIGSNLNTFPSSSSSSSTATTSSENEKKKPSSSSSSSSSSSGMFAVPEVPAHHRHKSSSNHLDKGRGGTPSSTPARAAASGPSRRRRHLEFTPTLRERQRGGGGNATLDESKVGRRYSGTAIANASDASLLAFEDHEGREGGRTRVSAAEMLQTEDNQNVPPHVIRFAHRFLTVLTHHTWPELRVRLQNFVRDVEKNDTGLIDAHVTVSEVERDSICHPVGHDSFIAGITTPFKQKKAQQRLRRIPDTPISSLLSSSKMGLVGGGGGADENSQRANAVGGEGMINLLQATVMIISAGGAHADNKNKELFNMHLGPISYEDESPSCRSLAPRKNEKMRREFGLLNNEIIGRGQGLLEGGGGEESRRQRILALHSPPSK